MDWSTVMVDDLPTKGAKRLDLPPQGLSQRRQQLVKSQAVFVGPRYVARQHPSDSVMCLTGMLQAALRGLFRGGGLSHPNECACHVNPGEHEFPASGYVRAAQSLESVGERTVGAMGLNQLLENRRLNRLDDAEVKSGFGAA